MEQDHRGKKFEAFLAGRAFLSASFRERFLADPEYAANALGLHLTESQIEHLQSLDPDKVEEWVAEFENYVGQTIVAMSAW